MSNVCAPSVLALYGFWRYSLTRLLNFLEALSIFHKIQPFTFYLKSRNKLQIFCSIQYREIEICICTHVQIRVGGVVQAGGLAGCKAGWGPGVRGRRRSPHIISPQATCLCSRSTPRWPSVYTSESSQAQHISMNTIIGQMFRCKFINSSSV